MATLENNTTSSQALGESVNDKPTFNMHPNFQGVDLLEDIIVTGTQSFPAETATIKTTNEVKMNPDVTAHSTEANDIEILNSTKNSVAKPIQRKKRLTKEEEKQRAQKIIALLQEGHPKLAIALKVGTDLATVNEITSDYLLSAEGRNIPQSKYGVTGTGFKIKDMKGTGFDKCDYISFSKNDDGSFTVKPFMIGGENV